MMANQYGAFNSPVWFNCGLYPRVRHHGLGRQLGVDRPGRRAIDETANAYERPQCSACFIQAVDDDLMGIYDLVKTRGAPVQVRLGHRLELQQDPRQAGEALGRRHLQRPDELPRGVRPRRGRHQERRHHAPRRQDGLPRHGPSGDRGLHPAGRSARRRRSRRSSRPASRATSTAKPTSTVSGQNSNNSVRVTDDFMKRRPRAAASGRRARAPRARSSTRYDGARALDRWSPRRVGLRRSGRAVRHHHQPLAHLPEQREDQRLEPVLRVHVPRRHGLQPVVAEPDQVPAARTAASTSRATATRSRSSSSRRRSWSISRATRPRASRRTRTTTARSASATRTSAPC